MKEVTKFIQDNLKDKTIVLGCSYGPDSMCLLNLLYNENIQVICAHVNHNIRKESKKEMQELKTYCNKHNITFESITLKKDDKSEAYYRIKRLAFLKEIANKYNTKYILTAHHADDLIETILMRITRKSNLTGYSGFKLINKENDYTFIKPLIFVTKEEIFKYNKHNSIPFAIDSSNNSDKYKRNRFRKKILPFLKDENKDVHKSFLKFSNDLIEADEYILKEVNIIKRDVFNDNVLDLKKYFKLDLYIQKRLLEQILKDIYEDNIHVISSKHVHILTNLLSKDKNFEYNLPKGWIVLREYDRLVFSCQSGQEKYNIEFDKKFDFPMGTIEVVDDSDKKDNFVIRLNSNELKLPLRVRTREENDRIVTKNTNYFKKVKKVFIDKKVPKRLRNIFPIVVDSDDNIIWIPGIIKSKFDVDVDSKYDIILKYTERKK